MHLETLYLFPSIQNKWKNAESQSISTTKREVNDTKCIPSHQGNRCGGLLFLKQVDMRQKNLWKRIYDFLLFSLSYVVHMINTQIEKYTEVRLWDVNLLAATIRALAGTSAYAAVLL